MENKLYNCICCGEEFFSKNPKVQYKRGHFWKGRHHSEESKRLLSEKRTGQKASKKAKEKMSERWQDPEYRQKMSEIYTGRKATPETKKLLSQVVKERWQDPEYQEKRKNSQKQYWKDPKSHEKRSELSTEFWKDPLRRKHHSDKMYEFWENNDDARLRQSKQTKQYWIDGRWTSEQSIKNSYGRSGYYKGIRMRSQVEIRCAMKLDSAGILWEYEPQRFYLEELDCSYLPDFYLPEFDTYLEVKYTSKGDPRVDALRKTGIKILLVQNKDLKCV